MKCTKFLNFFIKFEFFRHKWRLDILEGNKTAVYLILEWIFVNVDRLKERVYLSAYLTHVEVPPEEQTPEVLRIINNIKEKMITFKVTYSTNINF